MKDEIKEILNGLNVVIKHGGSVEINSKECKKIIDYITNLQEQIEIKSKGFKATVEELCETSEKLEQLQEENQRLKAQNTRYEIKMNSLIQENNVLKENAEHNDKVVDKAKWNEMIYKSRCEKAIEKLESIRTFGLRSGKTLFSTLINESIDILNGGEE